MWLGQSVLWGKVWRRETGHSLIRGLEWRCLDPFSYAHLQWVASSSIKPSAKARNPSRMLVATLPCG